VMSSPYCSGTERRGGMMKSMQQQDSLFLSRNFDKSAPLSRHQQERCTKLFISNSWTYV
jgi:hypothetical protein